MNYSPGRMLANFYHWFGELTYRRMLHIEINRLIQEHREHPDKVEAAYQRGFKHGKNKTVPLQKKLDQVTAERDRWRAKYKSEVPSLKYYINRLSHFVDPHDWQRVMQEKRPARESNRVDRRKGQ